MNILKQLQNKITILGSMTIGVMGHHYGSKMLSYNEDKANEIAEKIRDEKIESMNNKLSKISEILNKQGEQLDHISKTTNNIDKELTSVHESIDKGRIIIEDGNKLLESVPNSGVNKDEIIRLAKEKFSTGLTNLDDSSKKLNELLKLSESLNSGKDQFFSDFSSLYNYLDSLSLLEETAVFHLLVLLVILVIVFNIYSVLFGNEVIKYFKLEEKFPKLNIFFKLRIKFQRYYLILNLILIICICIFAIGLNILLFSL